VSDITDLRATENALREQAVALERARAEAEAASRGKDDFLATLSHELRTPLNAIVGWVRLLAEGGLTTDEQARAVEVIERNARIQAQLIEDLLDVSRIVAGKAHLALRPIHPVTLIDAVVDTPRPAAQAKQIHLDTKIDLRAGPIAADPARMQQVLSNIVANAIKFTGRGGRIDITLTRGASTVTIAVSDTGEGIASEMLPHVFERFRQAETGPTRRHGGLGIGLALVKHLVEAHGGTVTAESAGLGKGALLTVVLPLIKYSDAASAPRSSRTPVRPMMIVPTDALHRRRVLVVDDDPDALDLFARLLHRAGAEVHTAVSARDAATVMSSAAFDVVLSDIEMPGEDGLVFIERLRKEGSRLPVVAVTAYGTADDRSRMLSAGFDAVVAKPVDAGELVAVLRRLAGPGDAP
jgi:CheY-like chemotaxis protein/nitrogen-specific signal transduction histidine kinase